MPCMAMMMTQPRMVIEPGHRGSTTNLLLPQIVCSLLSVCVVQDTFLRRCSCVGRHRST